jgi:hypothetical protein
MTEFDTTDATTTTDAEGSGDDLFAAFAEAGAEENLAAKVVEVVEATPGLVESTRSGIDPASVKEGKVALVGLVVDNSISVKKLLAILGASHDQFIRALYPAVKEDVAILATAVLLDGTVLYPLTRINDVPLLGTEPTEYDRKVLDGLAYDGMDTRFNLISSTPLRDRDEQLAAAMLVEATKFENPRINREVDIILVDVTDGLDNSSATPVDKFSAFMEELDDTGTFTAATMYVGEMPAEGTVKYDKELALVRRYIEGFYGDVMPAGLYSMNLEDTLKWYFGRMGRSADRVFLPGGDPRAIRRAVGQVSDLAMQASQGAFREER